MHQLSIIYQFSPLYLIWINTHLAKHSAHIWKGGSFYLKMVRKHPCNRKVGRKIVNSGKPGTDLNITWGDLLKCVCNKGNIISAYIYVYSITRYIFLFVKMLSWNNNTPSIKQKFTLWVKKYIENRGIIIAV